MPTTPSPAHTAVQPLSMSVRELNPGEFIVALNPSFTKEGIDRLGALLGLFYTVLNPAAVADVVDHGDGLIRSIEDRFDRDGDRFVVVRAADFEALEAALHKLREGKEGVC